MAGGGGFEVVLSGAVGEKVTITALREGKGLGAGSPPPALAGTRPYYIKTVYFVRGEGAPGIHVMTDLQLLFVFSFGVLSVVWPGLWVLDPRQGPGDDAAWERLHRRREVDDDWRR